MNIIEVIKLCCYIVLVVCFSVIIWGFAIQPEPTPPPIATIGGVIDCRGADNVTFTNGYGNEIEIPRYEMVFLDDANNNRLTYILENGCTVVVKD